MPVYNNSATTVGYKAIEKEGSMNKTLLKSILLGVMVVVTLISGIAPIKLLNWLKHSKLQSTGRAALLISLFSCFAGGVFLSVCMLDMLPDSLEAWENVKNATDLNSDYPFVQLFALSGFFFVYLIEIFSDHACGGHSDDAHHEPRSRFATEGNIFSPEGAIVIDKEFESKTSQEQLEQPFTKSLTLVLAFLLHVGLECFAFGIQEDTVSITSLFFGIIIHKMIVCFSIGMKLTQNHPIRWWIPVILMAIIAGVNVIGGATGIIIEDANINQTGKDISTSVLMSLSLGTFIYITFFEILAPEYFNHRNKFLQFLAAFLGFVVIAVLMIFDN